MTRSDSVLSGGTTWVVVADSSRADIYSRAKRFSELESVKSFKEPAARAREQDLVSDGPGRSFDSKGSGRHAMESDQSEKHNLRAKFAKTIADELELSRQMHRFSHLILVAAPAMLGELRAHLSTETTKLVRDEIDKDMTAETATRIAELLDG
jgi:protein required for attachment to host cells